VPWARSQELPAAAGGIPPLPGTSTTDTDHPPIRHAATARSLVAHAACHRGMSCLELRPFGRKHLPLAGPWFAAATQRWLGGPAWPRQMLGRADRPLGEFCGAAETGRYRWLAWDQGAAVGSIDCGTYDRWATWEGGPRPSPGPRSPRTIHWPTSAAQLADFGRRAGRFQRGVSRPGRLSLVSTMLQDGTAPEARIRYQAQSSAPRRRRIRAIPGRAQTLGLIDPDADLEVAVIMGTGSWYARTLAGDDPPLGWPARTAALVWRAVGGAAPDPRQPGRRPHP
jgi:Tetracyclin repressor-like, C-terminal domain